MHAGALVIYKYKYKNVCVWKESGVEIFKCGVRKVSVWNPCGSYVERKLKSCCLLNLCNKQVKNLRLLCVAKVERTSRVDCVLGRARHATLLA